MSSLPKISDATNLSLLLSSCLKAHHWPVAKKHGRRHRCRCCQGNSQSWWDEMEKCWRSTVIDLSYHSLCVAISSTTLSPKGCFVALSHGFWLLGYTSVFLHFLPVTFIVWFLLLFAPFCSTILKPHLGRDKVDNCHIIFVQAVFSAFFLNFFPRLRYVTCFLAIITPGCVMSSDGIPPLKAAKFTRKRYSKAAIDVIIE